jgi:3-dehydroquinate synthase
MPTVPVRLAAAGYDVTVEPGALDLLGSLAAALPGVGRRCAVVTDSNVGPLFLGRATRALAAAGFEPAAVTVPAGEASKSLDEAGRCCVELSRLGIDRKSFLVALGGGVVGDLAGFVAAIHLRGIPFIQVPTTVVAQVDSAVGGKTGVNTAAGKNLAGAFHQPVAVAADPLTLATLPAREYNEGFAEVIKHAAIRDPAMLDGLAAAAARADPAALAPLLARNVAIKAAIVAADERETTGTRALLNFGHTLGHAIEAEAGYGNLLHGEAISLGLRAALWLSERRAGLDPAFSRRVLAALAAFDLPLVLGPEFDAHRLLARAGADKKFEGGQIRFVLLRAPGDAFVARDLSPADLAAALAELRAAPEPP